MEHFQDSQHINLDVSENTPYSINILLQKMESLLFQKTQSTKSIESTKISAQDKYYFYHSKQTIHMNIKNIEQSLKEVKKIFGRRLFYKFETICSQIRQNPETTPYLKYIYGILKVFSIDQTYVTRILIWIYSLCYSSRQKVSPTLKSIVYEHEKFFIILGLNILSTKNDQIQKIITDAQQSYSNRRLEKKFKKKMIQFIKNQEEKNHQEAYEICRICESHISVNLMQAHLTVCETIFEKKYLILKLEEIGREIYEKIKIDKVQYDFLDARADKKLFFDRVFIPLGEKKVIFEIKDDEIQIGQIIDQFRDNQSSIITRCVELLQKYFQNITVKATLAGYESEDSQRISHKSKIKSTKYLSRASIKLSSSSIAPQDSSKLSSYGSENQIKIIDDTTHNLSFKTSKTLYSLDDFDIIKLLGKGAYSQVYLVKNINTSDLFAMKVVEVQNVDPQTLQTLKKQQEIYKTINTDYAVKLYYTFSEQNLHFFLLEYASGGNLRTLLSKEVYFEQEYAKIYLANIILALESLHSMKILHRDLKPENIVIDEEGFLKLTDFNLALMLKRNDDSKEDQSRFFGSPDYIAPQVIKSQLKKHPSRDIWSLGIIAYEVLIGVTPFRAMQVQQVFQNILKSEIQWPEEDGEQGSISEEAKDLISKLLEPNPIKRIGFNGLDEIKNHKFFSSINWNNLHQHSAFYVPEHEIYDLTNDNGLKAKILERKINDATLNIPSLGCIIRYDALKNKSSMKAKSARKSRFKLQKQLNELKILTSMDKFPSTQFSEKSLYSACALKRSNSQISNTTIDIHNVSIHEIHQKSQKIIHEESQDEHCLKITEQEQCQ